MDIIGNIWGTNKTVLKYPKYLFDKKTVLKEKKKFKYQNLWKLTEDNKDYTLTLNPN